MHEDTRESAAAPDEYAGPTVGGTHPTQEDEMTESTAAPEEAHEGPDTPADIRDGGSTAVGGTPVGGDLPELPALPDSPDAVSDHEVDEVRGADDPAGDGVTEDSYALRSMPQEPNPTADDPASYLNP